MSANRIIIATLYSTIPGSNSGELMLNVSPRTLSGLNQGDNVYLLVENGNADPGNDTAQYNLNIKWRGNNVPSPLSDVPQSGNVGTPNPLGIFTGIKSGNFAPYTMTITIGDSSWEEDPRLKVGQPG